MKINQRGSDLCVSFDRSYTVELQWLEHWWLVYHGCFEHVLESLGKQILTADLGQFSVILLFYAPNFGEVEGAYWFGPVRPSVCPSVCLSIILGSWETREPLMLESLNFICGMYMKNKRTCIFFFLHQSCGSGVMPLFRLCMKNLVNRISWEPLKLEFWYLAYTYRPRCRWTD